MKCTSIIFYYVFIVILTACNGGDIVWAPYQVAIRLYDNFNVGGSNNINLCNGVIIHESTILTTAHCMHTHVLSANISRPLLSAMVYIAAGNFSNPILTRHINAIVIHEAFNRFTMENDIALLKLDQPLPLATDKNVKWVEIESSATMKHENCFVSFFNISSKSYPFTAQKPIMTMDNWFCNKTTNFTSKRQNDICSSYIYSDAFMCKQSADKFQLSYDRGTSLICNNKLAGLLSNILMDNSTVCHSTPAYYENIGKHFNWILKNIGISGTPHHIVTGAPPFYNPPVQSTVIPPKKAAAISSFNLSVTLLILLSATIMLSYT